MDATPHPPSEPADDVTRDAWGRPTDPVADIAWTEYRCATCGYSGGVRASDRCPECGRRWAPYAALLRAARRSYVALFGYGGAIASLACLFTPLVGTLTVLFGLGVTLSCHATLWRADVRWRASDLLPIVAIPIALVPWIAFGIGHLENAERLARLVRAFAFPSILLATAAGLASVALQARCIARAGGFVHGRRLAAWGTGCAFGAAGLIALSVAPSVFLAEPTNTVTMTCLAGPLLLIAILLSKLALDEFFPDQPPK